MSISQLSAVTAIKENHLRSLEEWKLSKLPPEIYVKGYLQILADYLKISHQDLIKEYRDQLSATDQYEDRKNNYSIKSEYVTNRNYFVWYFCGGVFGFVCLIMVFYSIIHSAGFFFLNDVKLTALSGSFLIEDNNKHIFNYQSNVATVQRATKIIVSKTNEFDRNSSSVKIYTKNNSWLSLKLSDSNKELYSGIVTVQESPIIFQARLPLKFYLGSATSFEIFVDETPYNFNKYITSNNTARFTVPKKK